MNIGAGEAHSRSFEACSDAAMGLHPFVAVAEPLATSKRWTVYYPRTANDRFTPTADDLVRALDNVMGGVWAYVNTGKNPYHVLLSPQTMSRDREDYR